MSALGYLLLNASAQEPREDGKKIHLVFLIGPGPADDRRVNLPSIDESTLSPEQMKVTYAPKRFHLAASKMSHLWSS